VPDNHYDDPRLAAIYDPLDPDRSDLDAYVAILAELDARSVLDVGCGTGTFAAMLAERGVEVVGVDPSGASLDVARSKSDAVTWSTATRPGCRRWRWTQRP
jgi:2-polyprenyl-3-methyl-5-hydroxy-6-metoxy-1,4-benzoquinol methylase